MSEECLLSALDNNYIAHAILDVFATEPLPPSSLLWGHPQITITPHVSALTTSKDVAQVIKDNFDNYIHKRPLKYQVSFEKGY